MVVVVWTYCTTLRALQVPVVGTAIDGGVPRQRDTTTRGLLGTRIEMSDGPCIGTVEIVITTRRSTIEDRQFRWIEGVRMKKWARQDRP